MLRTVKTENGIVEGLPSANTRITVFKGIPFAAPPVGENRWRAPQPCPDWQGVYKAYRYAPISVQDTPGLGTDVYCKEWHVDPEIPMDEDCLYLNVWTGAKSADEKLPVLVWFFGGALQWGYPSEMEFDGEQIAKRDVIVVSVNYRLNVFGFLAHPQILEQQPEAPANFGHLDQQAGLQWVKRNIAAFGGDPDRITIAGQSAGGGSVLSQIACPDNTGLFQQAVIMSGMIRSPYGKPEIGAPTELEQAMREGERFFSCLGVENLAQARKMDARTVLCKYNEFVQTHARFGTVMDGRFGIGDPLAMIASNTCMDVPIMAGNTRDEFPSILEAKDESELRRQAQILFGVDAETFLAFPQAHDKLGEAGYAPVSGLECSIKEVFERRRKNGSKTDSYYYRFDASIPGPDHPGTFHSVDLWFFFETLMKCWRPFTGVHYDLARQMCNYLTNFVKNGNPNGVDVDGKEMTQWEPYTEERPYEITFSTDKIVGKLDRNEYTHFLKGKIFTEKEADEG